MPALPGQDMMRALFPANFPVNKEEVLREWQACGEWLYRYRYTVPVCIVFAGKDLFLLPEPFVEQSQVCTIIDDGGNTALIHAGIVRYVEQAVGIHHHVASFHTKDLIHDEMKNAPAFHSEFVL